MDKSEIEANNKARRCALGNDVTDPNGCLEDCKYDKKLKRCVSKDPLADPTSTFAKFMDGKKYLTFRSNKKPAFSFRIPINADTLFGKYSGAIRFSPATGKLHLCYGPLAEQATHIGANRPVLSMLVKPKLGDNLWTWYLSSGKNLQKKRMRELAETDDVAYTDIYALPGASYQLSYSEANFLEATCADIDAKRVAGGDLPFGLKSEDLPEGLMFAQLANAPKSCPPVLDGVVPQGCLESVEFGARSMDDVDDEDYNQLAVLGHAPSKKQKELVSESESESESDDAGKTKKGKKGKAAKEVVRSPIPARFKEHLDASVALTSSLAKERTKAIEDKAKVVPDTGVLQDVFKYIKEQPYGGAQKCVFLRKGYHQTPAFAELNALIKQWDKSLSMVDDSNPDNIDYRNMLVGTTGFSINSTRPQSDAEKGCFYDMEYYTEDENGEEALEDTGVSSIINYLTNAIVDDRIPVCQVDDKRIVATHIDPTEAETRGDMDSGKARDRKKQYAMDFVQRLFLMNLDYLQKQELNITSDDIAAAFKCSFVASICLAWLKAFRDIYKPHDKDSMALSMDTHAFSDFAFVRKKKHGAKVNRARVWLFPVSGDRQNEEVFKELKTSLDFLSTRAYKEMLISKLGCTPLPPQFNVVRMLKDAYKISDARCESTLLELDTRPTQAYRSTGSKSVSRRARARARQYLSDSSSSSSESD